ncbi:UNVERIFIED_CONTAM: hypothetical protein PYX00_000276 [Menopon gallinae]|uniref:Uncharacterized protein n=1 Tax=Menopon gallinae TaxID=328185 RepID=A0AAW2I8C5_9NEOP
MAEGGLSPETPVHSRLWTGRVVIPVRSRTSQPFPKEAPCRAQPEEFDRDGNASEKDIFRKDSLYRDYLSGKDSFRDFRNSFNVAATESAIGLSKEQQMRASEFAAAALNYNKDPSRTSDIAGMILQHHQRALGLSIKPAHLGSTASLQHSSGPSHTIDAILGLGARASPPRQVREHSGRNETESSGE